MNDRSPSYFVFPYTTLFETEYRYLSLLLPNLALLQVIQAPIIPEWGKDQFTAWPTIHEAEELEQIKTYLRGYQSLAELHGERGPLSSASLQWVSGDALPESRFQIQSIIKEKNAMERDVRPWLRIEAATFLELARELDEKERDLTVGFSRLDRMEEEFREILGISDEEESSELLEASTLPIHHENQFSYMLPKRIGCWYRLFSSQSIDFSPCFVTTNEEVIEELFDPIRNQWERENRLFEPYKVTLATIPALRHLNSKDYLTLRKELMTSGTLSSFWKSVKDLVNHPHDPSTTQSHKPLMEALRSHVETFCRKTDAFEEDQIHFRLIHLEGCTHPDFWRKLDKTGYEGFGGKLPPLKTAILCSMTHEE